MGLLGAVFKVVAAPLSLRAGAVFGSRRGAAPLNPCLTRRLFVIVRLPVFARLLIQHLTLDITGPPNGNARNYTNCASAAPVHVVVRRVVEEHAQSYQQHFSEV